MKLLVALSVAALAGVCVPAQAQVEIHWWHGMGGPLGDWVNDLAKGFNESQKDYKVVATYKGYDESLPAAISAHRDGNAPNILQVYEVGTATMMASKGAIVPVWKIMQDAGRKFDTDAYVPAVADYYTAADGKMLSLPFNSSTTVFFYNKDLFKAAGLDPDKPPTTWPEVTLAAARLKASGSSCPLTTSWQGWTQLESFSAWHNVEFATQNNGFGGMDARLVFNGPLQVRHIENLANMARQGLFVYKGRGTVPDAAFIAGECAMSIDSSSTYGQLNRIAKFAFGVSTLPYYPDVPGAPQNTIIGGASLWAMSGKPAIENKGVAAFFEYLSSPQVQAASHQRTGYLPITKAAFELTEKSGFYQKNPGTDVAVNQMIRRTTDRSRGVRLGNYVQIRAIEDEELEQVWAGKKSAKEALDESVRRGNQLLAEFQAANGAVVDIPPPLLETRWFIALCVAASGLAALLAFGLRVRQASASRRIRHEERRAERERIARELHDTVLQGTQALVLQFQAAAKDMPDDSVTRKKVERALDHADEVMAEGRDRVMDLREPADASRDLAVAFGQIGNELAQGTSVAFSAVVEGVPIDLVWDVKDEVYRIGREAVTNAVRHARARSIEVQIIYADADLRVRVRDDGIGIDPVAFKAGSRPGHWGLPGMRERARRIGARLDMWSRPGSGTEIELTIPAALAYGERVPLRRWFRRWRVAGETTGGSE